jgi:hypothetical protein
LRSGPFFVYMRNFLNRREDPFDFLAEAIIYHANVLADRRGVTKQDLDNLEDKIMAKLSQIKADVARINDNLKEGLAEITARLAELVADNADPEVTDVEFTASLEAALASSEALADLANPEPSTDTGGEPTPTV